MLLEFTTKGIYCPKGNFYIDPSVGVDFALITHGHSDHARRGSKKYLAHIDTVEILKLRLGKKINIEGIDYKHEIKINDVNVTFFPSGHIIGASQIRVSDSNETWVVTGDYKLEDDGISKPFEHVECTHFVTESTFAKPNFQWKPQQEVFREMNDWWKENSLKGITSVISAYSLGKSQRILKNIDSNIGKIIVHSTIKETNEVVKKLGYKLPITYSYDEVNSADLKSALIITPSFSTLKELEDKNPTYSFAQASGWMQVRWYRSNNIDKGFIISDHADWNGLITAIKRSKAENIFVMHGYTTYFAKYLNSIGFNARAIKPKTLNQLELF